MSDFRAAEPPQAQAPPNIVDLMPRSEPNTVDLNPPKHFNLMNI